MSLAHARALVAPPSLCIFHTAFIRRRMVLALVQDWASSAAVPLMGGPRVGAASNPQPGIRAEGAPDSSIRWAPVHSLELITLRSNRRPPLFSWTAVRCAVRSVEHALVLRCETGLSQRGASCLSVAPTARWRLAETTAVCVSHVDSSFPKLANPDSWLPSDSPVMEFHAMNTRGGGHALKTSSRYRPPRLRRAPHGTSSRAG